MDTARNLLFGVLAWRSGLIDADQFTAGCRHWAQHPERPLADYLVERGRLSTEDRAALDPLLARNLERHGGDALAALKAVADAATWRAVAATNDAGLRRWLDGVLPGAAWLEEDEHKSKRGLVGSAAGLVLLCVLVGGGLLVGLGFTSVLFLRQQAGARMAEELAVAEAMEVRALAERNRQDAEEARQQAEANFRKARAAVDQLLTEAADRAVAKAEPDEPRRQLLEHAAASYETFLKEKNADPASRHEVATAYRRLGDIQQQLGQTDKAQQAYRQARDLLQKLTKEAPENKAYGKELTDVEDKLKAPTKPEKGKP
jgi:tetratricopeptide (TPR) repeat protein